MDKKTCEFFQQCPIFEKCKMGALSGAFIFLYCEGTKMDECERRILKRTGKSVPLNLLPNGEYFDPNR